MKITFFIGSMGCGGAERVISILANRYAEMGWQTEIVMLLEYKVNNDRLNLHSNIQLFDLTQSRHSYLRNSISWIKSIRNHISKSKPDIIISFVGRINALVLTATLGLKIPVIVSERNDPVNDGRGVIMLSYCRLIYHYASKVVFQTEYQRNCFRRLPDKKCERILNPVFLNSDTYEKVKENRYEVSSAGRLAPQKNHMMLIKAISIVKEKIPQIRCYIYGEGVLRNVLQEKTACLKLENNVFFPGNQNNIEDCIAKSSIFIMTSDYEGLSNALIEAMMMGKTCISTDYPGASEIIENGKNGFLVPCNDASKLAAQILYVIEDDKLRIKIKNNAKESSNAFSSEKILMAWEHLIDVTINNFG